MFVVVHANPDSAGSARKWVATRYGASAEQTNPHSRHNTYVQAKEVADCLNKYGYCLMDDCHTCRPLRMMRRTKLATSSTWAGTLNVELVVYEHGSEKYVALVDIIDNWDTPVSYAAVCELKQLKVIADGSRLESQLIEIPSSATIDEICFLISKWYVDKGITNEIS